jgi:DNA-binding GntR family transcriptional regulator
METEQAVPENGRPWSETGMTQEGVDLIQPVTRRLPVPMYEQVKQELREHIRRGGVGIGGQLPPIRELCRLFDVSRQTITKALDAIEAEGVIYRIQGKGTFVRSEPCIEAQFSELRGFTDMLATLGLQTRSDLIKVRDIPATTAVDAFFHMPPSPERSYVEITRLRYANDWPVVMNTSIVPSDLGKWMLAHSLETASYYQMFREYSGLPVTREDHIISICNVEGDDAAALRVSPDSVHFLVDSEVFVGDGIPMERSRSIFHRQHFRFHVRSVSFVPGEIAT